MDILGITFTTAQQWFLGVAGSAFVLLVTIRIPWIQFKKQRRVEAADAFARPFNDVLLNLKENPDLPVAQITKINHIEILAASHQFKPYIPWLRKNSFDKAIQQYKTACDIASEYNSIFAQFASEATDDARAKRKLLDESIQNLLSFAKKYRV